MAGPANKTAAAAPVGPPAARIDSAKGISNKLGNVRRTAINATIAILNTFALAVAPSVFNERRAIIHIEAQIPIKIKGTVLTDI